MPLPPLDVVPTPPRRKRRIGIVGAGAIVRAAHLPGYRQGELPVVGICDLRADAARELARRFEVPRVFADARELIESDEVEVVDIAIPDAGREELLELAARCGKPVLIQKPLAEDLATARRMVARAQASGHVLAVNMNARWAPEFRAARLLVESGCLGALYRLRWEMRNCADQQSWCKDSWNATVPRWQVLMWSIHHLDLLRYWTGETPRRVYCSMPRKPGQNLRGEIIASAVLDFASGVHATMLDDNASIATRDVLQEFSLEGTEGLVEGRVSAPRSFEVRLSAEPNAVYRPRLAGEWFPQGFLGTMCDLQRALEEGRAPLVTGADQLRTLELVDACYRSAASGQAVELDA